MQFARIKSQIQDTNFDLTFYFVEEESLNCEKEILSLYFVIIFFS